MTHSFLLQAAVFLAAAAIAAPLGRFLRAGSVIGYLAAGVLIGPYGLGFVYAVYQVETVLHIAELGVVLLLFLIGLELRLPRLWSMRQPIFGAGGAQLLATATLIGTAAWFWGISVTGAAVLGFALAMSSTAFVLQVLEEKGELKHRQGRMAFSILLMQDLAAIPLLAIVPLLATRDAATGTDAGLAIARAIAIIAAVVVLGRYVLRGVFHLVSKSGVREAMTASALLTVVGVALLMQFAGLSAALGAFLAGALLADSAYRHQIEADIAPFETLLLGLFFTAIGMSLNLPLLVRDWPVILALVVGLVAMKALVLFVIARWQGLETPAARRLAWYMSQGGEFAFVLLALSAGAAVLDKELTELLAVVVTLSMVTTPILLALDDLLFARTPPATLQFDTLPDAENVRVVIAGFGRVGQIVARILRARRIPFTALDISPDQINMVRRFGNEAYFGDATRLDILEAAKAGNASAVVIAIDDVEASVRLAELLRAHFPKVPIYARARNRQHVYRLLDLGVENIRRETFRSSLQLTRDLLAGLGLSEREINRTVDVFVEHDRKMLYEGYEHASNEEKMQSRARNAARELEALLTEDDADQPDETADDGKAASKPAGGMQDKA